MTFMTANIESVRQLKLCLITILSHFNLVSVFVTTALRISFPFSFESEQILSMFYLNPDFYFLNGRKKKEKRNTFSLVYYIQTYTYLHIDVVYIHTQARKLDSPCIEYIERYSFLCLYYINIYTHIYVYKRNLKTIKKSTLSSQMNKRSL